MHSQAWQGWCHLHSVRLSSVQSRKRSSYGTSLAKQSLRMLSRSSTLRGMGYRRLCDAIDAWIT